MKRTFVDSGVLIAALRGRPDIAVRAMEILDDADREFASSVFVKLEVLPKAFYLKRRHEVQFYTEFFNAVAHWADSIEQVVQDADRQARTWGSALWMLFMSLRLFRLVQRSW